MKTLPIISIEQEINASEQELFEYLTKDIKIEKWFATKAKTNPVEGGTYWFSFNYKEHKLAGLKNHTSTGKFIKVIPYQTIALNWQNRTLININLSKTNTGTKIELQHSGWKIPQDEAIMENYKNEWMNFLENLKSVIEQDVDLRPFNMHLKTKKHPSVLNEV
jgi:uncharacterized protein YndB with AHSA1/START domain